MGRRLSGKIVIATHNAGKLREMRELLAPYGVEAVSAGELGLGEPDETGEDFAANALIKARAAAKAANLPAFADDSGLCVESLGGAPGIYSARWAGDRRRARQSRGRRISSRRSRSAGRTGMSSNSRAASTAISSFRRRERQASATTPASSRMATTAPSEQ